jgi:hypothetical protein
VWDIINLMAYLPILRIYLYNTMYVFGVAQSEPSLQTYFVRRKVCAKTRTFSCMVCVPKTRQCVCSFYEQAKMDAINGITRGRPKG